MIKKERHKKILLQTPDGLKPQSIKIAEKLQDRTGSTVIISADTCYGACDIINQAYNDLDIDLIIQIGHKPIPTIQTTPPVIFIDAKLDFNIETLFKKTQKKLWGKKTGLLTTAQHIHLLPEIKNFMDKKNIPTLIGEGDQRISTPGLVLGCNFSSAESIKKKVDVFLSIGSGNFHPLGLMLTTKKPVIAYDPYNQKIASEKELNELKENILRQRYGAIALSQKANVFGILTSIKKGQTRKKQAFEIQKKLMKKTKKAYVLTLNNLSPEKLRVFRDIDCFISTACPRIAIDDYVTYNKPILTPVELDILLGEKKWGDYTFDEINDETK